MTIQQLRKELKDGTRMIRWSPSGIVEAANLQSSGAIRITNLISGMSYILPRRYTDFTFEILPNDSMIRLGDLLPKRMKELR